MSEGFGLADQARRRADPINRRAVGSGVEGAAATNYLFLWSPREAQEFCKGELAKPRTPDALRRVAPNAPRYDNLLVLVQACIEAAELSTARAYIAEADAINV